VQLARQVHLPKPSATKRDRHAYNGCICQYGQERNHNPKKDGQN